MVMISVRIWVRIRVRVNVSARVRLELAITLFQIVALTLRTSRCRLPIRAGRFEKDLQMFSSLLIIYLCGCADHENQNDNILQHFLSNFQF